MGAIGLRPVTYCTELGVDDWSSWGTFPRSHRVPDFGSIVGRSGNHREGVQIEEDVVGFFVDLSPCSCSLARTELDT